MVVHGLSLVGSAACCWAGERGEREAPPPGAGGTNKDCFDPRPRWGVESELITGTPGTGSKWLEREDAG